MKYCTPSTMEYSRAVLRCPKVIHTQVLLKSTTKYYSSTKNVLFRTFRT